MGIFLCFHQKKIVCILSFLKHGGKRLIFRKTPLGFAEVQKDKRGNMNSGEEEQASNEDRNKIEKQ